MNRNDPLLVGLDVGTTNIKTIVLEINGDVVASASVKTPTHHPRPGWAHYHPDELWSASQDALRQAIAQTPDPARIVSLAVASIGETGFPLDASGETVYDGLAWFDIRTEPQARQIEERIGADAAFASTGLPLHSIFGLCKLLWFRQNEPDLYARTHFWLNTADYIAFRLCGVAATDFSLASRMLALNLNNLAWDESLIAGVDLDPGLLAPLMPSGTALGAVRPDVAKTLGLSSETVIAVGGHDHICGAMALGITQPGTMLDSIGTAEALLLPLAHPITDPQAGRQGYEVGVHVSGGYYAFPSFRTSGACIEWFRDACAANADFAKLNAEAANVGPGAAGVRFLPHLRLAHSPHNDPKSRGAFIGLSSDVSRGALYRAILEGLAFEMRSALEPLLAYAGVDKLASISAIGGGTHNRLLMQIKATLMDQPFYVTELADATALGAALLGGIGAGVYQDAADAVSRVHSHSQPVEPVKEWSDLYDRLYREVYVLLYDALHPINQVNFPFKYDDGARV